MTSVILTFSITCHPKQTISFGRRRPDIVTSVILTFTITYHHIKPFLLLIDNNIKIIVTSVILTFTITYPKQAISTTTRN